MDDPLLILNGDCTVLAVQDEDEEKEDRGKEDTGEAVYLWDDKEGTVVSISSTT